jgi:hypothetical protein
MQGESSLHSYLIVEKVIYMCICDSSYPRKLAFSYLDELSKEFQRSYEGKIEGVTRPYAFMGFGELRNACISVSRQQLIVQTLSSRRRLACIKTLEPSHKAQAGVRHHHLSSTS